MEQHSSVVETHFDRLIYDTLSATQSDSCYFVPAPSAKRENIGPNTINNKLKKLLN